MENKKSQEELDQGLRLLNKITDVLYEDADISLGTLIDILICSLASAYNQIEDKQMRVLAILEGPGKIIRLINSKEDKHE